MLLKLVEKMHFKRISWCLILFGLNIVVNRCALKASEVTFYSSESVRKYAVHDVSRAIQMQLDWVQSAPDDFSLSSRLFELALLYWNDQQRDKAFEVFIQALDKMPMPQPKEPSLEEKKLYNDALHIYLDTSLGDESIRAGLIIEKFSSYLINNPGYDYLNLLIATSYANMDRYEQFFPLFYRSWKNYPKTFLSYKIRAVLLIKLLETQSNEEKRQRLKERVCHDLMQAAEFFTHDPTLFKMCIACAPASQENAVFQECLFKILDKLVKIPRQDIHFYVSRAIAVKEYELAENFLNQCRKWYFYSRSIEESQEILNAARAVNKVNASR